MLPWFFNGNFPLYLAPMAGVTNTVFRQICKEEGADVVVTEFVSAEGIYHRNQRTRDYLKFEACERPLGVQLFGGDPAHLALAARQVVDWVEPDFIDINYGCPAKKVVCKSGGSALLKDCPLLQSVAREIVEAVAPLPVTAKIRIGWDADSINAVTTARMLEDVGIQAIAVHGRTRAQAYRGEANWEVIGQVVQAVQIPVIGNGDLCSGADVKRRRDETGVAGAMIGRAAMSDPWIFRETKDYLISGRLPEPSAPVRKWDVIRKHCEHAVRVNLAGDERHTLQALRARLMAYSKGLRGGKRLRERFQSVESLAELAVIEEDYWQWLRSEGETGALDSEEPRVLAAA